MQKMQSETQAAMESQSRRDFFTSTASGLGGLALSQLIADEAAVGAGSRAASHFAPTAKHCIFIFLAGAPSHVDLYDPKPILVEKNGESLPKELTDKVRFAFIKKESAILMGSKRKFHRYGECQMELCDLLPHIGSCADDIALVRSMHTDAFNHHPAQLMMTTGVPRFGRPSLGSWLTYGLGSETKELPSYVVLSAGRGSSGGVSNWTSGFLPSTYEGVVFRGEGEPVLNLNNPPGYDLRMQKDSLNLINQLNRERLEQQNDTEIASRISAYELAFRMQQAAPELTDLNSETSATLDLYGVTRAEPQKNSFRGGGANVYQQFSKNCLLARRLIERGVRCVTLMHASWDHHSNLDAEISYNATMLDQPAAALVKDLKQRGLLDETLVICAGEFGRTPLGENRGGNKQNTGRDHHPYAYSLWMAGGGIRGGQVVGKTDDIGWAPVKDAVHVNDFHATILRLFGFDHHRLVHPFKGLDVRLTDQGGKVVEKLIG